MKLVFAIVQNDDVKGLVNALIEHEVSVTRISSSGGFLRGGNTTLMIGVEKDRVDETLAIIKSKSSRREKLTASSAAMPSINMEAQYNPVRVIVGGATVFVVDVENYYKL